MKTNNLLRNIIYAFLMMCVGTILGIFILIITYFVVGFFKLLTL